MAPAFKRESLSAPGSQSREPISDRLRTPGPTRSRMATCPRCLFAVSALLLAGLGVYGVVTYSVVQNQQEIGLRLSLGAQTANIYGLVLRDGLMPVLVGAAAGVGIAARFARVVGSLLFEVSPSNPAIVASAVSVLMAVGAAACLLPARRAAAIDPMRALRKE